jgi:hypothetical protein
VALTAQDYLHSSAVDVSVRHQRLCGRFSQVLNATKRSV